MKGISGRTPEQRYILLRLGFSALAYYDNESMYLSSSKNVRGESSSSKKAKIDTKEAIANIDMFGFLHNKEDRRFFLEFAKWMLLFQTEELLPSNLELPGKV